MLAESLSKYRIILASRSPRRQQLLKEMGLFFDIVVKDYPETYPEGLTGEEIALHVAREKALSFEGHLADNDIVIAADTIVWCNNKVLGKPSGRAESLSILREISGNTHEVITGVSLFSAARKIVFSETTRVTFERLSEEEMEYYTDNYKPYDKAGAYGIQEWIGIVGCSRIEGSYFNVVGLPVQRLYRELGRFVRDER